MGPLALLIMAGLDVYSPTAVVDATGTKFYYGGWMTPADIPAQGGGDSIFATICGRTTCAEPVKVLDPAGTGFYAFNDPSVVWKPPYGEYPGYYLMYLTCSVVNSVELQQNVCLSTSFDGAAWSEPLVVQYFSWTPSVIVVDDQVWLYANDEEEGGYVSIRHMGYSGAVPSAPRAVEMQGPGYDAGRFSNPAVIIQDGGYWMLVEHNYDDDTSRIDECASNDGVDWEVTTQGIAVSASVPGSYRVGTPAYLTPDVILFAATPRTDSEGFMIYAVDR